MADPPGFLQTLCSTVVSRHFQAVSDIDPALTLLYFLPPDSACDFPGLPQRQAPGVYLRSPLSHSIHDLCPHSLGAGTEGGPGAGFERDVRAGFGAGFQGRVQAGMQARMEVGAGNVLGTCGMWRDLGFY